MLLSHPTKVHSYPTQPTTAGRNVPAHQPQPSTLLSSSSSSSPLNLNDSTTSLDHINSTGANSLYTQSTQQPPLVDYNNQAFTVPRALQPTNADQIPDLMPSDSWVMASQYTPKTNQRLSSHQRESSLSSLGSTGPASPFSQNTTHPQIAVSESAGDGFTDLPHVQDGGNAYYQLAKSLGPPDAVSMYPGYHSLGQMDHPDMGYPATLPIHSAKMDKTALLPAPDFGSVQSKSHPPSLASSTVGGDSPATPSLGEPNVTEEDKRRKTSTYSSADDCFMGLSGLPDFAAIPDPPKLDRTISDIYSDELYNPSFAIVSATPSQPAQVASSSPSNEVFAQRLHAANSQHLSAGQSPASSVSRDRSPFRHDSPLVSSSNAPQEYGATPSSSKSHINIAEQMSQSEKSDQEAQLLAQQITAKPEPETPKTISPKDAMLEFQVPDADPVNFPPLFPQQVPGDFNMDQALKIASLQEQYAALQNAVPHNAFNGAGDFNFMAPQVQPMPGKSQIPQQYPFVPRPRQQNFQHAPRLNSQETSTTSSNATPVPMQKPPGASADGGTYTCTYHGCTMRFETPALLQKHKREGHRQPQGLANTPHRGSDMTDPSNNTPFNTQAGPHRCDRINPSTGKPCHTIFSRPYDLTRHEDTIHNARKQKVRCDLCTEEKTFSRADALTRHYRVCHPEVEFPGKHRRRGGHS